jgi:L-asparaginase II
MIEMKHNERSGKVDTGETGPDLLASSPKFNVAVPDSRGSGLARASGDHRQVGRFPRGLEKVSTAYPRSDSVDGYSLTNADTALACNNAVRPGVAPV